MERLECGTNFYGKNYYYLYVDERNIEKQLYECSKQKYKNIRADYLAESIIDYSIDDDLYGWSEEDMWKQKETLSKELATLDYDELVKLENEIDENKYPSNYCSWLFHYVFLKHTFNKYKQRKSIYEEIETDDYIIYKYTIKD